MRGRVRDRARTMTTSCSSPLGENKRRSSRVYGIVVRMTTHLRDNPSPTSAAAPAWVEALVARVTAETTVISSVLADPTDECLTAWPGARSNVPLYFDTSNLRNQSVLRLLMEETGKPAPYARATPTGRRSCARGCFNPRHYSWKPRPSKRDRADRDDVREDVLDVLQNRVLPADAGEIHRHVGEDRASEGLVRSILRDLEKEGTAKSVIEHSGEPGRPPTTWIFAR